MKTVDIWMVVMMMMLKMSHVSSSSVGHNHGVMGVSWNEHCALRMERGRTKMMVTYGSIRPCCCCSCIGIRQTSEDVGTHDARVMCTYNATKHSSGDDLYRQTQVYRCPITGAMTTTGRRDFLLPFVRLTSLAQHQQSVGYLGQVTGGADAALGAT